VRAFNFSIILLSLVTVLVTLIFSLIAFDKRVNCVNVGEQLGLDTHYSNGICSAKVK
jgi:hypothetical protein